MATTLLAMATLPSCREEIAGSREAFTAPQISGLFERRPTFIKIGEEVLLAVNQRGEDLFFFKTASGYGEAGAEAAAFGSGLGLDRPVASIYSRIYPLEALALVKNNWHRIYSAVRDDGKRFPDAVDADLVKEVFRSIASDPLNESYFPETSEYRVTYGKASEVNDSANTIPVHLSLGESTLLQVAQRNGQLEFYKTSSGYATLGNKTYVGGTGGSYEVSFSDHYMGITPEEAVAHAGGDWQVIYKAVLKQARIIPDSVWPSLVRETFCPNCPVPDGGVVELIVEDGRVLGPAEYPKTQSKLDGAGLGTDVAELKVPTSMNVRPILVGSETEIISAIEAGEPGEFERLVEEVRRTYSAVDY